MGKYTVPMIMTVCPDSLATIQSFLVGIHESCRTVCIPGIRLVNSKQWEMLNTIKSATGVCHPDMQAVTIWILQIKTFHTSESVSGKTWHDHTWINTCLTQIQATNSQKESWSITNHYPCFDTWNHVSQKLNHHPAALGWSMIGKGSHNTSQGSVTPLGWNNGHYPAFRPYSRHGSVHSGSILICLPSDSLHINTELSHVYSLAWLLYIYLPLHSEKAPSAKWHHLLPSSRETLHKTGKSLISIFRYSFRDLFSISPHCSSILKGMLDNIICSDSSNSFGIIILWLFLISFVMNQDTYSL